MQALKAQLRQELGVLEEQYRAVMAQSTSPPTSPPDWTPHCAGCEHVESLRQRFKEQVASSKTLSLPSIIHFETWTYRCIVLDMQVLETEALRRENETLERRLWQHTDFLDKLQWYLTRQVRSPHLHCMVPSPVANKSDLLPS